MKKLLVIFGSGDIAQLAHYYFSTDSNYFYVSTTSNMQLSKTKISMTSLGGDTISTTVALTPGKCTQISQQFRQ